MLLNVDTQTYTIHPFLIFSPIRREAPPSLEFSAVETTVAVNRTHEVQVMPRPNSLTPGEELHRASVVKLVWLPSTD